MPAGRPRTTSYHPDIMIELGKEMIEWLNNHPDTLHLSEWYSIEKMFIYEEWKTFIQRPEFIPYYEQALKLIGKKYLQKDSGVEPNIKNRWQRVYFNDIREREDQDKKDEIEIAKKATQNFSDEEVNQMEKLLEQMKKARKKLER